MDWITFKTVITDAFGLSRDALHLVAGFAAHFALVIAFRSSFRAFWPLLIIAAATLGNEWLDLTIEPWEGESRTRQWWESGKDLLLTLAMPVALVLLSRLAPTRFAPVPRSVGNGS